jgi:hypothetical protein
MFRHVRRVAFRRRVTHALEPLVRFADFAQRSLGLDLQQQLDQQGLQSS